MASQPTRLKAAVLGATGAVGQRFVEHLAGRFHEFRLGLLLRAIVGEGSVSQAFERTYGLTLEAAEAAWWRDIEGSAGAPGGGTTSPPAKG